MVTTLVFSLAKIFFPILMHNLIKCICIKTIQYIHILQINAYLNMTNDI